MKTKKEIKEQKRIDLEFIISAVTDRLLGVARIEYSSILDNNGYFWLYDECVTITHQILFEEGSAYLKYLDLWAKGENPDFHELNNECFDWYHMNKALEVWESKYGEEKNNEEEIFVAKSEMIGYMIDEQKDFEGCGLMTAALEFSNELKEKRKESKQQMIEKIVEKLNNSEVGDVQKVLQKLNNKKED